MAKVEVVVEEPAEEMEYSGLQEATRKIFLAGVGAAAVTREALRDWFAKLVERGERMEEDGRKLAHERMEKGKHRVRKVVKKRKEEVSAASDEMEKRIAGLMETMNVPSKDDIDALSAKIAELTEKVDELKKA
jgi:poly(hydroxyalkanoate) granule-associated protein